MSDQLAILIEPHGGNVTAPRFPGEADPDHPGGRYWHVRTLIDTADPGAVDLSGPVAITVWIDGRAIERRRSVNTTATLVVRNLLDSADLVICGPILVTGGTKEHPAPLSRDEVDRVASDLLGTDPADIQDAHDEAPAFAAAHLFIFERQDDADPDQPGAYPVEAEERDE